MIFVNQHRLSYLCDVINERFEAVVNPVLPTSRLAALDIFSLSAFSLPIFSVNFVTHLVCTMNIAEWMIHRSFEIVTNRFLQLSVSKQTNNNHINVWEKPPILCRLMEDANTCVFLSQMWFHTRWFTFIEEESRSSGWGVTERSWHCCSVSEKSPNIQTDLWRDMKFFVRQRQNTIASKNDWSRDHSGRTPRTLSKVFIVHVCRILSAWSWIESYEVYWDVLLQQIDQRNV